MLVYRPWLAVIAAASLIGGMSYASQGLAEIPEVLRQPRRFPTNDGRFVLHVEAEERVIERGSGIRTRPDGRMERFSTSKVALLAKARLVECDKLGRERERWSATLYDFPRHVLISPEGDQVVTYDTLDPRRGGHELVLYDGRGELLAGYELDEVLSPAEIDKHVRPENKDLEWGQAARIELHSKTGEVAARFPWGKVLRYSLRDGKAIED